MAILRRPLRRFCKPTLKVYDVDESKSHLEKEWHTHYCGECASRHHSCRNIQSRRKMKKHHFLRRHERRLPYLRVFSQRHRHTCGCTQRYRWCSHTVAYDSKYHRTDSKGKPSPQSLYFLAEY